jgi:mono/diheme cytochrome c family protein
MRSLIGGFTLAWFFCTNAIAVAGDADNGLRLARRWCASCHIVTGGQARASDAVPAFASVAARKDFNADKIAAFLLNPHPIMPNMSLTRDEANDIAAYIATLRR